MLYTVFLSALASCVQAAASNAVSQKTFVNFHAGCRMRCIRAAFEICRLVALFR